MNETRVKVMPVTDLLAYEIRSGQISNEGGHKIFGIALKNPDLVRCDHEHTGISICRRQIRSQG